VVKVNRSDKVIESSKLKVLFESAVAVTEKVGNNVGRL